MRTTAKANREVYLAVDLAIEENRELCRGIFRYAHPGHSWVFFFVKPQASAIRDLAGQGGRHGLIGRLGRDDLAAAAASLPFPAVNVHGGNVMRGLPQIGPDHRAVGRFAARQIAAFQYPACAFYGLKGADFSECAREGFLAGTRESGGGAVRIFEQSAAEKVRRSKERNPLRDWLAALPKPCALYCPTDYLAMEASFLCSQAGIPVPEEVAILGTNNDEIVCMSSQPPVSSIRLPWREIGFHAASMLDRMFRHDLETTVQFIGVPELVARQSTARIYCEDESVARALRLIQEAPFAISSVADLAARCGRSRRLLEKRFQAALARSPLEEIHRVRVEEIKRLLRQEDLTLEQIAGRCGFSSGFYLGQFFKRETGSSPGGYRRTFRSIPDPR